VTIPPGRAGRTRNGTCAGEAGGETTEGARVRPGTEAGPETGSERVARRTAGAGPPVQGSPARRSRRGPFIGVCLFALIALVLASPALLTGCAGSGDEAKPEEGGPAVVATATAPATGVEAADLRVAREAQAEASSRAAETARPVKESEAEGDGVVRYEGGYRFDCNGWIYLHIEGAPFERGEQHGRLMAEELQQVVEMLAGVTYIENGVRWPALRDAAAKLYQGKLAPELVDEMKGIAAGARAAGADVTYRDVLTWNAYEELTGYWWPNVVAGKLPDLAAQSRDRCSAFVATGSYTADGRPVIAHNNWNVYNAGRFDNVILDLVPDDGHRMVMQSAPGFIDSGTDFFVTDAGLMGTETTIGGFTSYDPDGVPEFARARLAMQGADDLDGFVRIMQRGNNGGYANSWLLADRESGEIMRFEQGLEYQGIERKDDGYFVGFNGAVDPRIRNLECSGGSDFFDTRTAVGARRVRLEQLMEEHKGAIDPAAARAVLADHYDPYLREAGGPNSRTIEGRYDLDDMRYWADRLPYSPHGAVDGKVMDGALADELSFQARFGSSSGIEFDASVYLEAHPQWDYLADYLVDLPAEPWTRFGAGDE